MDNALAPHPTPVAPTLGTTPPAALASQTDDNTSAIPHLVDTTDPAIPTQLRLAALDKQELQIIAATIEVKAVAPTWSLQQGVILYNDRYYIPATSPLLEDLLESLGTTTPQLQAVGLHTAASAPTSHALPSSILLVEA